MGRCGHGAGQLASMPRAGLCSPTPGGALAGCSSPQSCGRAALAAGADAAHALVPGGPAYEQAVQHTLALQARPDLASLFYTSGTREETAKVMEPHRNLLTTTLCYFSGVDDIAPGSAPMVYAAPMSARRGHLQLRADAAWRAPRGAALGRFPVRPSSCSSRLQGGRLTLLPLMVRRKRAGTAVGCKNLVSMGNEWTGHGKLAKTADEYGQCHLLPKLQIGAFLIKT